MRQLCLSGMNVARMNFSHGDHDSHKAMLSQLQALREELELPIAAMCDTKGPEIRTGLFEGGAAVLRAGGHLYPLRGGADGQPVRLLYHLLQAFGGGLSGGPHLYRRRTY